MNSLIGQKFGKLTVIKQDKSCHKNNRRYWICQCDCGNITKPISTSSLTSGNTKSCGCLKKITSANNISKANNSINLIGKRFGKLVVIEQDKQSHKDGFAYWICRCDCGNITKPIRSASLKDGRTKSCGCINSLGNQLIKSILVHENISFCEEYVFDDLYGDSRHLRFDFAIFDINNKIKCLIEYQGRQHYEPSEYYGGEIAFKKQKEYDNLKKNYCIKNNIQLIIIPYTDFNKIDNDYIVSIVKG